jgi:hypothetical protein
MTTDSLLSLWSSHGKADPFGRAGMNGHMYFKTDNMKFDIAYFWFLSETLEESTCESTGFFTDSPGLEYMARIDT